LRNSGYSLFFLSISVFFAAACAIDSADVVKGDFDEAKLTEMLSVHGVDFEGCEHVFVVSEYQCKGCSERVLSSMVSENLQPTLESSCWIAPYQIPEEFDGHEMRWEEVSQADIEKIIPYAANITYIRLMPSGVSAFQELGVKWVDPQQLEQLFKE
jgi:hypothetical protein